MRCTVLLPRPSRRASSETPRSASRERNTLSSRAALRTVESPPCGISVTAPVPQAAATASARRPRRAARAAPRPDLAAAPKPARTAPRFAARSRRPAWRAPARAGPWSPARAGSWPPPRPPSAAPVPAAASGRGRPRETSAPAPRRHDGSPRRTARRPCASARGASVPASASETLHPERSSIWNAYSLSGTLGEVCSTRQALPALGGIVGILRLAHVDVRTPDLELSTAYYTEV